MKDIDSWSNLFLSSLQSSIEKIVSALPTIFWTLIIFVLGWLIAKFVSYAISKVLKLMKFNQIANRINADDYLRKANISLSPSQLVGKFVYYIILLLVFITASETLGWHAVSSEISKLIAFLPRLFIAIVIFIFGVYVSALIRDIIAGATSSLGISTGKMIASFVFYLIVITISLTALSQAGIDTTIITSNVLLILGAVLISAAISYGFASRDVLSNILAGFYSRKLYQKGMQIEVDQTVGIVENISTTGIAIRDKNGDLTIVPTSTLIKHKVKIIESRS